MLLLENDTLKASVLDPVVDTERLGTRYCSGGYIFQVEDKCVGANLLAVPAQLSREEALRHGQIWEGGEGYNVSDGQGLPDTFLGHGMKQEQDETGLVIGVGLCCGTQVVEHCDWTIDTPSPEVLIFTTNHDFRGQKLELTRTVSLHNRTLISKTKLENTGATLALSWVSESYFSLFRVSSSAVCRVSSKPLCYPSPQCKPAPHLQYPHPFFPQPTADTNELLKFSVPISVPVDSAAYTIAPVFPSVRRILNAAI
jgi:hypothetical protein